MSEESRVSHGPMGHSDLEAVLAIEATSFAAPWTRNMFLEEMSNRTAELVVFRAEDRVVGYLCYWSVVDEAHLLNIAVHPAHRRRGLGKLIMGRLESSCRESGLNRILLDVGRRNKPARELYKSCGFKSIGFRKNYYAEIQDDALVMEKRLDLGSDARQPMEKEA